MDKLLAPGDGGDNRLERAPGAVIEVRPRRGLVDALVDFMRVRFSRLGRGGESRTTDTTVRSDERLRDYPADVVGQFASGVERILHAHTDQEGRIRESDASQAARDVAEVVIACVNLWSLKQSSAMDPREKEQRRILILQTLKTIVLERARDLYSGHPLACFNMSLEHSIRIGSALSSYRY